MSYLRLLPYSRSRPVDGALIWRQAIQNRLREALCRPSGFGESLTPETWRAGWKSRWSTFVRKNLDSIRAEAGKPVACENRGGQDYGSFRIEKIAFDAVPGWTVGLTLFLPAGPGPFIPVLCPCGHGPKWLEEHQYPPQVLARNGFAAALFDMPMFGERFRDNDHFIQGPQSLMTGLPSLFYFLVDIPRVADVLAVRSDIDTSRGFGVTGVSGGGLATMFMPLADERVKAIVPVCCATPLGAHLVDGLYTGCQENYMEGQAALGLDLHDLLALAAPMPCRVMGGRDDELFRLSSIEKAAADVRRIYALEGAPERFDLYVEDCGHCYTPTMAAHAARWFQRWLGGRADRAVSSEVQALSAAELDCGTAPQTEGMLQMTRRRVARGAARRIPRTDNPALRELLRWPPDLAPPSGGGTGARDLADEVEELPPPTGWGPQGLVRRILHRSGDLSLPLLELTTGTAPAGTIIGMGDAGLLHLLRVAAGGLGGLRRRVIAADIRGYGELEPEPVDYDFHSWCGIDRALGDLLLLAGETAWGQQARDALRVIDYAVATGADPATLTLYGKGAAAWPVVFAGLLHPAVRRVVIDEALVSWADLASTATPVWNRYHFLPHGLEFFDLPELLRARADRQFLVCHPRGADGRRLDAVELRPWFGDHPVPAHLLVHTGADASAGLIDAWLKRGG